MSLPVNIQWFCKNMKAAVITDLMKKHELLLTSITEKRSKGCGGFFFRRSRKRKLTNADRGSCPVSYCVTVSGKHFPQTAQECLRYMKIKCQNAVKRRSASNPKIGFFS